MVKINGKEAADVCGMTVSQYLSANNYNPKPVSYTHLDVYKRQERTDSNHVRLKLLYKLQILVQGLHCLSRRADHEAAAHLISYLFQIPKALLSVCK